MLRPATECAGVDRHASRNRELQAAVAVSVRPRPSRGHLPAPRARLTVARHGVPSRERAEKGAGLEIPRQRTPMRSPAALPDVGLTSVRRARGPTARSTRADTKSLRHELPIRLRRRRWSPHSRACSLADRRGRSHRASRKTAAPLAPSGSAHADVARRRLHAQLLPESEDYGAIVWFAHDPGAAARAFGKLGGCAGR